MRKAGYTQSAIASCFGCSGSTISREVRHNLGRRGYRHKQVDEVTDQRIFESRKRREVYPEAQVSVEGYLREQAKRRGNDSKDLRVWAVYR
jgi:IS30 family transposase